jgi:ketosteroid isomerase-like protein
MKKLLIIPFALAFASCGNKATTSDPNKEKADPKVLLDVEMEFSKMSAEKGMKEAFLHFAADDGVKLQPRSFPAVGKDAIKKMVEESETTGEQPILTWQPVKADISASGDLGYTYGNYKLRLPADSSGNSEVLYGNYMTVWKKMADGSWKYVLDGGNSTPEPGKE